MRGTHLTKKHAQNQTFWKALRETIRNVRDFKQPGWTEEEDTQLFDMASQYNRYSWDCNTPPKDLKERFLGVDMEHEEFRLQDRVYQHEEDMHFQLPVSIFECMIKHSPPLPHKNATDIKKRWFHLAAAYRKVFQEQAEIVATKALQETSGFKECIKQIKEVSENPNKYAAMQKEPLVLNFADSVLDPAYYGKRIRIIMSFSKSLHH